MNMNRVILGLVIAMGCSGTALAQTNTAFGTGALVSNTTGFANSAFGYQALHLNDIGGTNTATGYEALFRNTSGGNNTATGESALEFNSTGGGNTANGTSALDSNTTGDYNSAFGASALFSNTNGIFNTGAGWGALISNTTGSYNNAFGTQALDHSTTGSKNNAVGGSALFKNTNGNYNQALGSQALYGNTTGSYNIGIGYQAGYFPTTGSNNIEIGATGSASDTRVIRIGTQGTQNKTYLAGVRGVNVVGGMAVMVTSTGQLGVVVSSRRYKEDIRSMGDTSERLLKLRPVTFRYKKADENGQKPEQYGLIAEEVAKVMPELVIYDDKDQPETVAYQTLTPLLLNELQREHSQLSMQGAELRALRSEVGELRRLTARLAAERKGAGSGD